MKVFLVGAGPGHENWLTLAVREVLQRASLVVTTPRLYAQLGHLNSHTLAKSVGEFTETVVAARGEHDSVAVLVSGDTGFFSIAKGLMKKLAAYPDMEVSCLNGLNSMQYLCGKLGVSYETVKAVSLHGREGNILPFVAYNPLVFALSGGTIKAHTVINSLVEAGLGDVEIAVGENLAAPDERLFTGTAAHLRDERFGDLASLLIRNRTCVNPYNVLVDKDFIRGTVPMTKQAVRVTAMAALNIQPGDCLWDIGAGTGSVSITMARQAHEGLVYAIERKAEALELIRKNRALHGAYNVVVIEGSAPESLDSLPKPDKVFIGGSSGHLRAITDVLKALNPEVTIVVTAISLETVQEALSIFKQGSALKAHSCGEAGARAGRLPALMSGLTADEMTGNKANNTSVPRIAGASGDHWAGIQKCSLETAKRAGQEFGQEQPSVEIMCLNVAMSDKVGSYHLMKAENPVYIIKGRL